MKKPKVLSHEINGLRPGDLPQDSELPPGAAGAGVSWFALQFTLPVDNPVNNVFKRVRKGGYIFEVPINFPDIHNLNYADLLVIAEEAELSRVSTPLNNRVDSK